MYWKRCYISQLWLTGPLQLSVEWPLGGHSLSSWRTRARLCLGSMKRKDRDIERDRCARHVSFTPLPPLSRALSSTFKAPPCQWQYRKCLLTYLCFTMHAPDPHPSSVLAIKQLLCQLIISQTFFNVNCQGFECQKACCTSV